MDNSTNGDTSRRSPPHLTFNNSLNHLFSNEEHPKPSTLAQTSSRCMEKMARASCHIMFLILCRDHDMIPKGLTLKDPMKSIESAKILHLASVSLLKQQLKVLRQQFAKSKKNYDETMTTLKNILDNDYYRKLTELNMATSRKHHKLHLATHQKKFYQLITRYNVPFVNPYDNIGTFEISQPTFSGIFKQTSPRMKKDADVVRNTVVNLSDELLEEDETNLLSLGLKFSPSIEKDSVTKMSSSLEPVLKKLDPAVESAAAYDVTNNLTKTKTRKSNISVVQQKALKSLGKKSKRMKILSADKGNAAVVLSNSQYETKMEEHLSTNTYEVLKKDPTESLARKLDNVLKKLLKEKKISKQFYDDSRTLHPRAPQIYGLPKIHKPGTPLRPIVSFYDTPLSALHKQLANVLKPLTASNIRLKNSEDFLERFRADIDGQYPYYCSLDVKSLYTSCDMHKAVDTVTENLKIKPGLITKDITPEAIKSLLIFSLDNSYFEFNNTFFRQISGGPMGSPLTVALAEVRVSDIEATAIRTSPDPPKSYYHFVDDGFGYFRNSDHANSFRLHLNSLAPDLEYSIEHPRPDGSIPFLDINIHPDNSTSIYRKPTHTNLYTHYSSAATLSSKESVVRTLTRRAFKLCSSKHLGNELQHLEATFLSNGYPLQKIRHLMQKTLERLRTTTRPSSNPSLAQSNLLAAVPYSQSYASSIRKSLAKYDITTAFSTSSTLKSLLSHTKSSTPPDKLKNVIYKIPCHDCDDFYIGQTCRPLIKRIKEHEACQRLNNYTDSATGNIKSAPAKHAHDHGHNIDWNGTSIVTACAHRSQLNLLEHAAITILDPPMNIQHKGPRVNPCWNPLLDTIARNFKYTSANVIL